MIKIKNMINKVMNFQTGSLKAMSIRSAIWSLLGNGSGYIIRMGGNLILTRILYPEAFGLMATANTILLFVDLLFQLQVVHLLAR